jgi:hypothetical protein
VLFSTKLQLAGHHLAYELLKKTCSFTQGRSACKVFLNKNVSQKRQMGLVQWEFQDPKMEVLYHIRPYFVGIFPYIGLIYIYTW